MDKKKTSATSEVMEDLRKLSSMASSMLAGVADQPKQSAREAHRQFLMKQVLHATTLLRLGATTDCMLISRSMIEGAAFLSWINEPGFLEDRANQWLTHGIVRHHQLFETLDEQDRTVSLAVSEEYVRKFGGRFLKKSARSLPSDAPVTGSNYSGEWHNGIKVALEHYAGYGSEFYGFYSGWSHWESYTSTMIAMLGDEELFEAIGRDAIAVGAAALAETLRMASQYFGLGEPDFSTIINRKIVDPNPE